MSRHIRHVFWFQCYDRSYLLYCVNWAIVLLSLWRVSYDFSFKRVRPIRLSRLLSFWINFLYRQTFAQKLHIKLWLFTWLSSLVVWTFCLSYYPLVPFPLSSVRSIGFIDNHISHSFFTSLGSIHSVSVHFDLLYLHRVCRMIVYWIFGTSIAFPKTQVVQYRTSRLGAMIPYSWQSQKKTCSNESPTLEGHNTEMACHILSYLCFLKTE